MKCIYTISEQPKWADWFILFLDLLGLQAAVHRAFSSGGQWGLLFIMEGGLLLAVASLLVEHGL